MADLEGTLTTIRERVDAGSDLRAPDAAGSRYLRPVLTRRADPQNRG